MKICYYPAYTIKSGSSRLRVFFIKEKLLEWGHDVWLQSAPFDADIVIIQKIQNRSLLNIGNKCKRKGIPVVFDYDDPANWRLMIELAETVTSDSWGLIEFGKKLTKKKFDGRVIRNPVDYIKDPLPKREHKKKTNLEIVYFAFPPNLVAFKNCRPALERLKGEGFKFSFTYISGKEMPQFFKGFQHKWLPWSYETFSRDLREFDLAVLPQAWNWKGPSKQVQSVAHNVPAVCEDIRPNRHLYKIAGLTEYLASTDEEWYRAIKKLFDPKERNKFQDKAFPAVWKTHSFDYIANKWLSLFKELTQK